MLNLSPNKLFLIAGVFVVVVIILVMVVFLGRGFGGGEEAGQPKTIQFWGVFDDSNDFRSSLTTFEQRSSRVKIIYRQFNFEDYEKELVEALASGRGPDIFMIHNTWLPKHQERIAPLPQFPAGQEEPLFTIRNFQEQFVDVAEKDLVVKGEIYGLPLYVDTLALYYNKGIFNALGVASPPDTWEEFNEIVEKTTKIADNGEIARAGAAIGTAKNINRSIDILSLLMMQSGVPMTDPATGRAKLSYWVNNQDRGQIALEYYTDFANPFKRVYTWNQSSFYSIDAFQQGTVAMMFNYAHQIGVLRAKAPRLNFGIAPMPQLDLDSPLNYANYWATTVSKFSTVQEEAWKFLVYLHSAEGIIPYLNSAQHPTARRDLVNEQKEELDLGVFAKQALTATSWYQVDNLAMEGILAAMIEEVNLRRKTPSAALDAAESQINLLMQRSRK